MNHMLDFYNLYIIGLVVKRSTNATHNMTPFDLDFRFKPEVENLKNSYLINDVIFKHKFCSRL